MSDVNHAFATSDAFLSRISLASSGAAIDVVVNNVEIAETINTCINFFITQKLWHGGDGASRA
jgi:hypothetical protein